jgi:hypothetical protein
MKEIMNPDDNDIYARQFGDVTIRAFKDNLGEDWNVLDDILDCLGVDFDKAVEIISSERIRWANVEGTTIAVISSDDFIYLLHMYTEGSLENIIELQQDQISMLKNHIRDLEAILAGFPLGGRGRI